MSKVSQSDYPVAVRATTEALRKFSVAMTEAIQSLQRMNRAMHRSGVKFRNRKLRE